jgi:rhodanese-related sulfurtransferase
VVLLDVRPEREYESGHLPGARSLPLLELIQRLEELPREQELVAYCRGHFCVMADAAVRELRQRGFKARRLDDGVPEWREHGYPIENESGPAA